LKKISSHFFARQDDVEGEDDGAKCQLGRQSLSQTSLASLVKCLRASSADYPRVEHLTCKY